jgi:hypothetical protein
LPDVTRFDGGHRGRLAQVSFSLFTFARKDMTFKSLIALDLAAAGHAESFGRSSIGFYFWHFVFTPCDMNSGDGN